MIKSTKSTLKFTNIQKHDSLSRFIKEYRDVVSKFVDIMWETDDISKFVDKEACSKVSTWLSARAIQCAGKQASGIVRGCKKKQQQRQSQIDKFREEKQFKKARILQRIYDEVSVTKPNIGEVEPELDSRFVKIDLDNPTSFDGWVTLGSLGSKLKIQIPFRKHDHFNKMLSAGQLKRGVRLNNKSMTFMFDIPEVKAVENGLTLGIDIGKTTIYSCSDGRAIGKNKHGHDVTSICDILSRRKKGSKGFARAQAHRTNYSGWAANHIDLTGVRQINRENIKNLRYGKRTSRELRHWTYTEIFGRLDAKAASLGVPVIELNPAYTSQRCSECGWVHKGNRNGKKFVCGKCGYTHDADLNASRNLSLSLLPLGKQQWLKNSNISGFYWNESDGEPIVPHTPKTEMIENFQSLT